MSLISIQGIALQSQMPQMSAVRVSDCGYTIALTGAALHSVGPIPRKNVPKPSFRYDCSAQSTALEYLRPGPMISVCIRDLITSKVNHITSGDTNWIRSQPHGFSRSIIRLLNSGSTVHHKDIVSTRGYPSV